MSGFRYLLALENRDPVDPAVFVTAVSEWNVGQTFVVSNGQLFRRLSSGSCLSPCRGFR